MNRYYFTGGSPRNDLKSFFTGKSVLAKLIIINLAVWVLIRFIGVLLYLFNSDEAINSLIGWFAVPASLDTLITRPWSIFTYMFLHYDFFHILFNMLWLFWFGKIFLEYLNERQLATVYLLGGLAGALLYIVAYNVFPVYRDIFPRSVALGASASVMAVVVAISVYIPNYTIYLLFLGQVKIKYIAIVSIILDFLMIRSGNSGGHIAHIGGAIFGYLFIVSLKRGNDFSLLFKNFYPGKILGWFKTEKKANFQKVHTNKQKGRPVSDEEYNYQRARQQDKIDGILDKISKSGYESLTREEKELLFKMSDKSR